MLNVNNFPVPRIHFLITLGSLLSVILTADFAFGQGAAPGVFALRSMLQDKTTEIRIKAAEGLGRVGGRESVLILRRGLSDKNSEVRVAVIKALGFVGGQLAITVLSEALKDKSAEVRLRTVEACCAAVYERGSSYRACS